MKNQRQHLKSIDSNVLFRGDDEPRTGSSPAEGGESDKGGDSGSAGVV